MSDFENKLRSLELRQPLPEWQREISEQCTFTGPQPTWRQWLWPSPLAWAALVLIWFGLTVANHFGEPSLSRSAGTIDVGAPSFAYRLDDADSFWPLAAALPQ